MVREFMTRLRQMIVDEKIRLDVMKLSEDEYRRRFEEIIIKYTDNIFISSGMFNSFLPSMDEAIENLRGNVRTLNNSRQR